MKKHTLPQFVPSVYKIPNKKDSAHDLLLYPYNKTPIHEKFYYISMSSCSVITSNQMESAKKILNSTLKKYKLKSWSLVHYNIILTKKSTRMGKGKGKVIGRVALVKKRERIFQFEKFSPTIVGQVIRKLNYKLPVSIYLS